MITCLKSFSVRLHSFKSAVVVAAVISIVSFGSASAMGINGLIGVQPGFPQIDVNGGPGQGVSFTPFLDINLDPTGQGLLRVSSTPGLYFPDASSLDLIQNGLFDLSAVIGPTGMSPIGLVITNGTTGGGLADPLLVADILEYGLENTSSNPGGTDRADFLLNPLGGSMLNDLNWNAGSLVGITMTLEGSTYDGNLDGAWEAGRAKMTIGQVAVGLTEPTTLPLFLMGLAGFWFLRRRLAKIRA